MPHYATKSPRDRASSCRLSDLVGRVVTTVTGRTIGEVDDVAVRLRAHDCPVVTGILADAGGRKAFFGHDALAYGSMDRVALRRGAVGRAPALSGDEVLLRRDVLGRRLAELATADLLRACDVELVASREGWVLSGVYTHPPRWLEFFHRPPTREFRAWRDFAPLVSDGLTSVPDGPRRVRPPRVSAGGDFAGLLEQVVAAAKMDATAAADAVTSFLRPRPATLLAHHTDA